MRRGVTLIELLFVIGILGILGVIGAGIAANAFADAKAARTKAIVTKANQLILAKWETYRTRAVRVSLPIGATNVDAARARLLALRELQRCEMPDRISDVADSLAIIALPSLQRQYRRRALSSWTTQHEGAECLYLILAAMRDGEDNALSFFAASEVGDVDGDGMHEILDAWGRPVEFLRWAPGFTAEAGAVTVQTSDSNKAPDYFDPLRVDPRWSDSDTTFAPYCLIPLIYAAGPDGEYGMNAGGISYATTSPPNDPYLAASPMIGSMLGSEAADNITSHAIR